MPTVQSIREPMQSRILIIDDEVKVARALSRVIEQQGYDVTRCSSPIEALTFLQEQPFDLVISDQRMPLLNGTELLMQVRELNPEMKAILMSAYTDFNDVVDAFNQGYIDHFLPKPWDDEEVGNLIAGILDSPAEIPQFVSNPSAVEPASPDPEDMTNFCGLLSRSPIMEATFHKLRKAALANMPVFICGETGTGKEMSARSIHLNSGRAEHPFVSFNCANFSEELMVSQLFGHKKGAFTGAISDQKGLLADVGAGTLFLDEVTSFDISLQAKLLRVLQEREFSVLGSNELQPFQGQIVSASSEALRCAVERGGFREDLRYRMEVIAVNLPPLRERPEDILFLFRRFLSDAGKPGIKLAEPVKKTPGGILLAWQRSAAP